jgi:hypothetical protein
VRILLFTIVFLSFFVTCATAQHARVNRFSTPLAGKVTLKDIEDKYNASVYDTEAPDVDNDADIKKLRDIKSKINSRFPRRQERTAHKTTSVQSPILGINFIADSMSGIPPDNCSAISKGNKAVCVMNQNIAVHDATTGAMLYRKSLQFFSGSTGLNGINDFRYDPKVVYDPEADRFISIILNGTNQYNYVILGFSQTNDPAGAWSFYKFKGDYNNDTTWFDYPSISITQNEIFFTGNKIQYDGSWQAGFRQTLIYQVHKQDGYSGALSLSYQIWDSIYYNNKPLRCLYPLNPGNSLSGPAQYFLSNRNFDPLNDTVFLVQVPDTIGSTDTLLTITPLVSSLSYGVPPDARQPDTNYTLATNDGRVLGGFIQGNEIQFVSTSVNPVNGVSAVYHGVISNYNTAPALTGRLFSIDTLDFGYPNISFAGNYTGSNEAIISFEYSGPHKFPGLGAILFDGSNFSDMLQVKNGTVSIIKISGKEQRWGDYSGSQPDWNTSGIVWVEGIYGRKDPSSDASYGSHMAQLISPDRVHAPEIIKQTATSKVYPNPAMEYVTFDFSVEHDQVFSFMVCDMNGRTVDKILDRFCHSGKNVIRFNIASLPPGAYLLKAFGASGENIAVHTFVRR